MKISGFQKVSTIDYPGEICCVVFLRGCNFRCGFCYNSDLVVRESEGEFSPEEILRFLSTRIGKLDAVCISGGEPLVSLDFDWCWKIKEMGFKIKLDTNGSFPDRLKEMIDLGLVDYIAMDVKGAREDYFKIVNANVDLEKIERSMKIVNDFGAGEFRTTIVSDLHSEKGLVEMGNWMNEVCDGKPRKIFLQGFRRGDRMIDSSFVLKDNVLEGELLRLKGCVEGLFGEVGIRS